MPSGQTWRARRLAAVDRPRRAVRRAQAGYVGSAPPARSSEDREPARLSRCRADAHGFGARQRATSTPCGNSDRGPSRSHVAHLTPDGDPWSPTAHRYLARGALRPAPAPADASAAKAKPPEVDPRLQQGRAGCLHQSLSSPCRALANGRCRRGHLWAQSWTSSHSYLTPSPLLTNAIELCNVRGKISWPPHSPI